MKWKEKKSKLRLFITFILIFSLAASSLVVMAETIDSDMQMDCIDAQEEELATQEPLLKELKVEEPLLEEAKDEMFAPMAIVNPGPGSYDVANNNLILEVLGTSTNSHAYATIAWYDEFGNFYMAVQSTHILGGVMTITSGSYTVTSTDTHIYAVMQNITVEGEAYAPNTHVSGNTGDSRWTVYMFANANITAGTYTFDVTGIGGGHDIKGRPLKISVPKIDINVTKIWDGGEGTRPNVELQLYISENAVVGTSVTLVHPDTTHTWKGMDATDGKGVLLNYTVKENPINDYETIVTGNAIEGFIVKNIYVPLVDVTIKKNVTGNFGDLLRKFSFIVTTDKSNSFNFELSHNEEKLLENLPTDAVLTLMENVNGYEVTVTVDGNSIPPGPGGVYTINVASMANKTITVTNHKDVVIDTGISLDSLPYVLILVFAIVGLAIMVIRKRNIHN